MGEFPRISIVTPSYNQSKFLEQTITSVLIQDYPNLEYIVMDGGSTDGSVDIIREYADRLAFWTSEPDGGHADAVYKGFERATGEILGWVNSDDYYLPGSLKAVGELFARKPTADWVIGHSICVDEEGKLLYRRWCPPISFQSLLYWKVGFEQPATFWRKEAFFSTGGFNMALRFSFDYDLFFRLARRQRPERIDAFLAATRHHPNTKTSTLVDVKKEDDERLFVKYGRYDHHSLYLSYVTRKYRFLELLRHCARDFQIWVNIHLTKGKIPSLHKFLVEPEKYPGGR